MCCIGLCDIEFLGCCGGEFWLEIGDGNYMVGWVGDVVGKMVYLVDYVGFDDVDVGLYC